MIGNNSNRQALYLPKRYLSLFRNLHWYLADFIMFLMIIGPLIAPDFQRSSDPARQVVANIIFGIGKFVCPQLEYSFQYDGMAYAVCYRCVAAILGLVIARTLHAYSPAIRNAAWKLRWSFLLATILWLTIDVQFTHYGIWTANIPLMVVHGILYGMSVGGIIFGSLVMIDKRFEHVQETQRINYWVSEISENNVLPDAHGITEGI